MYAERAIVEAKTFIYFNPSGSAQQSLVAAHKRPNTSKKPNVQIQCDFVLLSAWSLFPNENIKSGDERRETQKIVDAVIDFFRRINIGLLPLS